MNLKYLEDLYFGLWLQSNRQNWELWYSLYKGEGQKPVMVYPAETKSLFEEELKMKEILLHYFNHSEEDNRIILPFQPQKRLQEECGRPKPEIFRCFWHSHHVHIEFGELFITYKNGKWIEIEKPTGMLNFAGYESELEQSKMKEMKRKSVEEYEQKKLNQTEVVIEPSTVETEAEIKHIDPIIKEEKVSIINDFPNLQVPPGDQEDKDQLTLFI